MKRIPGLATAAYLATASLAASDSFEAMERRNFARFLTSTFDGVLANAEQLDFAVEPIYRQTALFKLDGTACNQVETSGPDGGDAIALRQVARRFPAQIGPLIETPFRYHAQPITRPPGEVSVFFFEDGTCFFIIAFRR